MSPPAQLPKGWLKIGGITLAIAAASGAFLTFAWPYKEERVLQALREATGCVVRTAKFHSRLLPQPGCELDGVVFTREGKPLATADRITLRSSWLHVITIQDRVRELRAAGLHVVVPSGRSATGSEAAGQKRSTTVDELVADSSVVEFESKKPGNKALRFDLHRLKLTDVSSHKRIGFSALVANPEPPGELAVSGFLGPVAAAADTGKIQLSGDFDLKDARLDKYEDIKGLLSGHGKFTGVVSALDVHAQAEVTDFEANHSGHPVHLRTVAKASVNGLTGDVTLHSVEAKFRRTLLFAAGTVSSESKGAEKTVSVDFSGDRVRIDDLLYISTRSGPAPVAGPMKLQAHVVLPPGHDRFLRRVRLNGTFGVEDARWSRVETQLKVDELSARARGRKEDEEPGNKERVLTDLQGAVALRGGVASLSGLRFRIPGAVASGSGTFNLISKRIDMEGLLAMESNLSDTTSGIKSVLLKPFNGLFRRSGQKRGATIPVSVTGVYPRPQYRIRLKK